MLARRLPAAVLVAIIGLAAALALAERPKHRQQPKQHAVLHAIPVGAIKIPLRCVEQPDGWSCGAASLMSICAYYNVGPRTVQAFKEALGTDAVDGTYYRDIAKYAEKLGLSADIEKPMSFDRLRQLIDQGKPVICSIQAYSDDKNPDYHTDDNGHYVVAIGYDTDNFYFMDPSANYEGAVANPRYGCLTKAELELRWHENEAKTGKPPERYSHLGIVVYPAKTDSLLRARMIE